MFSTASSHYLLASLFSATYLCNWGEPGVARYRVVIGQVLGKARTLDYEITHSVCGQLGDQELHSLLSTGISVYRTLLVK
jgi:hypothetical protein